jgi:hypothetical protein
MPLNPRLQGGHTHAGQRGDGGRSPLSGDSGIVDTNCIVATASATHAAVGRTQAITCTSDGSMNTFRSVNVNAHSSSVCTLTARPLPPRSWREHLHLQAAPARLHLALVEMALRRTVSALFTATSACDICAKSLPPSA